VVIVTPFIFWSLLSVLLANIAVFRLCSYFETS